jgi:hypothetical protein
MVAAFLLDPQGRDYLVFPAPKERNLYLRCTRLLKSNCLSFQFDLVLSEDSVLGFFYIY